MTVELGTRYKYQFIGAKRRLVQKSDTFQYVPLIDNLQWILQNKEVYNEVRKSTSLYIQELYELLILIHGTLQVFDKHVSNTSCYLHDFCDGILYKQHPLFGVDDNALQVIIYYDDVEVANPLGSYRGQHKLGMQNTNSDIMCLQISGYNYMYCM